jgi:Fe-S cluster assembly protein SufD
MWHPRLAIDIEDKAEAVVLERHIGPEAGSYLANHAADIRVGDGARFVHAKLQSEGAEGRHLAMSRIRVGKDALYDNFILTLGAALSRSEAAVRLEGEGCEVRLNGAYSISGRQHADHTSRIDHLAEGTRSRQVFAGAIGENARGVFQGHIVVDRLAQRTDGHQLNRALLLSDHAEINSKPILEIYADDVKCSHGATAGDIDDDQLFYLRARGIPADKARMLVVRGFLAEAAGGISNADVKAAILDALDDVIGVEIAL